jgi:hypothetical protein
VQPVVSDIGHATLGHAAWELPGSLPIGSQLTRKMPEKLVHTLLCRSLVTTGLKVIH